MLHSIQHARGGGESESIARRFLRNVVPGDSGSGGVPVNTIWRSPVEDAARVNMMAFTCSSVRSCASSNTTICMSANPRVLARERAENCILPPLVRMMVSSPFV